MASAVPCRGDCNHHGHLQLHAPSAHLHQTKGNAQRGAQRCSQHDAAGRRGGRLDAAVHCGRGRAGTSCCGLVRLRSNSVSTLLCAQTPACACTSTRRRLERLTRVSKGGAGGQAAVGGIQKVAPPSVHPAQHLHSRPAGCKTFCGAPTGEHRPAGRPARSAAHRQAGVQRGRPGAEQAGSPVQAPSAAELLCGAWQAAPCLRQLSKPDQEAASAGTQSPTNQPPCPPARNSSPPPHLHPIKHRRQAAKVQAPAHRCVGNARQALRVGFCHSASGMQLGGRVGRRLRGACRPGTGQHRADTGVNGCTGDFEDCPQL